MEQKSLETKEEHLSKIQILVEQSDYDSAIEQIAAYKETWDYDDEIAVLEGEALISTGKPMEAIISIEKGLAHNSSNYELYFMLGESYELLGNGECAELCYRYAVYQCHKEDDLPFLKQNLERFLQAFGTILPKLSILIKVSKNPDWLKLCLKMIPLYTIPERYEILFIEDDPSPELQKWLREESIGKFIPAPADSSDSVVNPSGYNRAIECAEPGSDLVIIEEGGLPLEHTFFTLQMALYGIPETGAAGSVANTFGKYLKRSCLSADEAVSYAHQYNVPSESIPVSSLELPGPIYMLRRFFIKRYGWFDPDFSHSYYQIRDYFFRLIRNNKKVLLCPNSLCIVTSQKPHSWDKNGLDRFHRKWGVNLTYSCFSRDDLLSLIQREPESFNAPVHILEVGCACGATLLELKRRFPRAELYGIELDQGPASIAGHFASISQANIEDSTLDYPENFFDYIIFGDVLEHLRDPGKVLERIKTHLKADGSIIASIPNVMHISVVKGLLSGYWTYENAGILDRTHLKFFTYQEILRMFQDCGYQIDSVSATAIPVSEEDEALVSQLAKIRNVPENWFKAYQYLVTARRC